MKKRFLLKSCLLFLIFGISLSFIGCPQSAGGGEDRQDNNPQTQDVPKALIASVDLLSQGNGWKRNLYNGQEVNTKGKTGVRVLLKSGISPDDVKIAVKLAGADVVFSDFNESYEGVSSVCEDITGITAEAKEMVITVSKGNAVDTRKFMLKEFDESTLQEIGLQEFVLAGSSITDNFKNGNLSYRIYDKSSNKVEFAATLTEDVKEAVMIVDGVSTVLQATEADKKVVKGELEFEKNSVKVFSFVFKAEGCKDLSTNSISLTFTNILNAIIEVDANGGGRGRALTDAEVISGNVEFSKCMVTEPKILVKALKSRDAKLTKVTVDGVDVEIKTEDAGTETEAYVANYTLNPPLEKAGDKKTVKLHIEGTSVDGTSVKEATDINIDFTLVQFIEAKIQIEADGKPFMDVGGFGAHRVYTPNVKIKVVSTSDDLKDVVVKDYEGADGSSAEFDITGKEATAVLKLKDTGMEATRFKITLSAEGKTNTTIPVALRYTAQDDPLGFGFVSFQQGDIEKATDPDGAVVMTRDEAVLYILLNRNVKELTSMKVNGVEVMGKPQADPDMIVMDAKMIQSQGMGGVNRNAVFVFGGEKMQQNKIYSLTISMAGKDEDGHNLRESTLPTLKIKQPDFGKGNTDWRSPQGTNEMGLTVLAKTHHNDDKLQLYYNYYSIQSIEFAVNTKNPKAKVKGIWYRHDQLCSEREAILKDAQEENSSTWGKNFLKFEEKETMFGKSKWCTTINFEDPDKQGYGIGVYLWVVSEDGTKSSKGQKAENLVNTPYEQFFRRLGVMCSQKKLENNVGWENGWKDSIQVIDKAEIDINDENVKRDKKVYCRASTYGWAMGEVEYHLFNDTPQVPISDFLRIMDGQWNHDNRFTVDVSTVVDEQKELEVQIPVYMKSVKPGKEFTANVFTRKFKIVKKN